MSTAGKSAGSSIQLSDLQDWYTTFTTFATNYGTTAMKPTMSNTTKPVAADYNTLVNLVTTYRADSYLGTVTWPDPTTVTSGVTKMTISTTHSGINAIKAVQDTIKCRNSITYSNVNNSNGTGNSYCNDRCSESYYNEGHVSLSNTYYNCCQSRSYYCSQSTYTHSNVAKQNGSKIDVLNSKTS